MTEDIWQSLREMEFDPFVPEEDRIRPFFTAAMKQAVSDAMKGNKCCLGRVLSEETKKKIGDANRGKPSYWKGKTLPPEMVAKMKANLPDRKGSNNPRSSTWRLQFEDGRVVVTESLQTWAVENGYPPTSVRNLYNGRGVKNYRGIVKVEKLNNISVQEVR
jgi:hypothetical protein